MSQIGGKTKLTTVFVIESRLRHDPDTVQQGPDFLQDSPFRQSQDQRLVRQYGRRQCGRGRNGRGWQLCLQNWTAPGCDSTNGAVVTLGICQVRTDYGTVA